MKKHLKKITLVSFLVLIPIMFILHKDEAEIFKPDIASDLDSSPVTSESSDSKTRNVISSISNSRNPITKGEATDVDKVYFTITHKNTVVDSGYITVFDNKWSHQVTEDLNDGKYRMFVYSEAVEKGKFEMTIPIAGRTLNKGGLAAGRSFRVNVD